VVVGAPPIRFCRSARTQRATAPCNSAIPSGDGGALARAFHYKPTSASWLNQVEGFFGILGKQSLSVTDFYSKAALREHLAVYMRAWNRNPTPFAWTKPAHAIIRSHRQMLERISTAVH
jgi:hypothetical protein